MVKSTLSLTVRNDSSRCTWVSFTRHKSDATDCFEQFVPDTRADGILSEAVMVRPDGGREFCGEKFGDLCRSTGIRQESTTADSPQFNGVAEFTLGLIWTAQMAGQIQARELSPRRAITGNCVVVG